MAVAITLAVLAISSGVTHAHCQIPCGIYNDMMRVVMLKEHITTLEKSVKMIDELSGKSSPAELNQLVRWIDSKDEHADLISEIATEYFLKQRIKAPAGDQAEARARYLEQLEVLHGILVTSMKVKQNVDPGLAAELRTLVDRLAELYFDEDELAHLKAHH
jgi:nickel superoxide dismutase